MNRRLLFVAPSAYTLSGLATWLDYLLPGLCRLGWEPHLGLVAGSLHHRPDGYLKHHPFTPTHSILCRTGTELGRRRAIVQCLKDVVPTAVVSVNIPDSIMATASFRLKTRQSVHTIMTCHGIQQDLFADMKRMQGFVDGVACTNRLACRLASRLGGIDPARVGYASCGSMAAESRLVKTLKSGVFRILFVGRLENIQKRVLDLPAILSEFSRSYELPWELSIVGDGPDRAVLEERLLPFGDSVKFHGQVSSDRVVHDFLPLADAFLLTSFWETGPIVVWEAMAGRVPVISSRYIGAGAEGALRHDLNCLLYDIGDARTAANHLLRLSTDPELCQKLISNAAALAKDGYSHEVSIRLWDQVLQKFMSLPNNSGLVPAPRSPGGRLDRYLSNDLAESVRSRFFCRKTSTCPGSEWPHTLTGNQIPEEEFWSVARTLDCESDV